jgi:hypothetical protein
MEKMMNTSVNLVECWSQDEADAPAQPLEIVRLSADETAVVPFTPSAVQVKLHYCDMADVQGYVHCNGDNCAMCRAGKTADERLLLPVYSPQTQRIGVLPISPASRPGSLRPQVMPALRSGKPVVLLIRKPDRTTFRVRPLPLTPDVDDGAVVVKEFRQRMEAGEVDLTSVYARMDNVGMEALPGVGVMLKLKEGAGRARD